MPTWYSIGTLASVTLASWLTSILQLCKFLYTDSYLSFMLGLLRTGNLRLKMHWFGKLLANVGNFVYNLHPTTSAIFNICFYKIQASVEIHKGPYPLQNFDATLLQRKEFDFRNSTTNTMEHSYPSSRKDTLWIFYFRVFHDILI